MNTTATSIQEGQQTETSLYLQLLLALNMLLHTAKIHQDNNRVLFSAVHKLVSIIKRLLEEENEITIIMHGGRFYLQQEKVAYRPNMAGIVESLLEFFENRKFNGLRFFQGIGEASVKEIASFA
ncbi:MAG: hypothetical protein OEM01_15190, partial [Desulfobulbaceae bacterium]|nr:hypothetical protein [Desulfobulbaceae bacterium]